MKARERWKQIQEILQTKQDGIPGKKDQAALEELRLAARLDMDWPKEEVSLKEPPASPVDERSEKVIAGLLPELRPYARKLVKEAAAQGITIKLISGLRAYEEQQFLYEQGRSRPGKIVTNAQAGYSSHNFGTAFDIGVFQGSDYVEEGPQYDKVGAIGKEIGLSWGGDWAFEDNPHFYLKPEWAKGMSESQMMAELRRRHDSNQPVFS